ncbi:NAD(P)-binding domain-containing protein [Algoriphagus halophytocola]|uniref:NAD(P)-binding domain-containing protein n=1 Tax=Algoriphagus halophytocola TaxID=2991499 RepID=A0ABY6MGJ5_9BACT|nr:MULTISPECIES: NAD(P)H-binding protein [unclassified Algoriphagus]UZD21309.1 NAD(P)-binding domain-containing protein [Algoriphagus sp. TR-M5]WBL42520.1 NAD(P)-binding domain-containing protein [Algoriphagus sp. TR-M9]
MKISIIGLGWIGLPLAKLLQKDGHEVIGSTTSAEKQLQLKEQGIKAIHFALVPFPQGKGFQQLFDSEILVVNIPPKTRSTDGQLYLEQLKFLQSIVKQSSIKKIVFVSSTGVYPQAGRSKAYQEEEDITLENTGNRTQFKGEQTFKGHGDLTIVRFGGLLGDDRIPGKYAAGKENVAGHTRVNFIYRNDAARLLLWVIKNELWNQTFNGVAPVHSLRKDIYEKNASDLGLQLPASYQNERNEEDRLISGQKILDSGFEFEYPNPLDFPYSM